MRDIPNVNPGRFIVPRDGSKKTSREDEAKSSKRETKSGGSKGLPLAIYMALIAYLKQLSIEVYDLMQFFNSKGNIY